MTMMSRAYEAAEISTCNRLHVGAVIARGETLLASGWNGGPEPCDHTTDEPCREAVHAEVRAVGLMAMRGLPTSGATIFVTHSPCLSCAQLILVSGLRCVWNEPYRDLAGARLLRDAQIGQLEMTPENLHASGARLGIPREVTESLIGWKFG